MGALDASLGIRAGVSSDHPRSPVASLRLAFKWFPTYRHLLVPDAAAAQGRWLIAIPRAACAHGDHPAATDPRNPVSPCESASRLSETRDCRRVESLSTIPLTLTGAVTP